MRKNNFFIVGMIILAGVLFTACPYSSTVPLSDAKIKYESEWLGKWVLDDEYSENPNYFILDDIDGVKFRVEKYEYNSMDEIYELSGTYACHFTDIGKTRFVNIREDDTFYFYKIEMVGTSQFKLFEVTDNIDERPSSSKELMTFFTKYKDLSFFYNNDEETYKKSVE